VELCCWLHGVLRVKLSIFRPGEAVGAGKGWAARICRQSAHDGGKVRAPHTGHLYPRETSLLVISIRG